MSDFYFRCTQIHNRFLFAIADRLTTLSHTRLSSSVYLSRSDVIDVRITTEYCLFHKRRFFIRHSIDDGSHSHNHTICALLYDNYYNRAIVSRMCFSHSFQCSLCTHVWSYTHMLRAKYCCRRWLCICANCQKSPYNNVHNINMHTKNYINKNCSVLFKGHDYFRSLSIKISTEKKKTFHHNLRLIWIDPIFIFILLCLWSFIWHTLNRIYSRNLLCGSFLFSSLHFTRNWSWCARCWSYTELTVCFFDETNKRERRPHNLSICIQRAH